VIDRDTERTRLIEAADRSPQLIVLRGRRRVGKSYLVDQVLGDRRGVFFQADEQDEAGHLEVFGREAGTLLPGSPSLTFGSWDDAFEFVGAQATDVGPLVLALDEFQWLWDAQPAIDSILQRHWDRWQRAEVPATVVLSGSALSRMEQLLERGRPLHGRADYRPLLLPLDYRDAAEFAAPSASAEERLRRYAVIGGTPQYEVWAGNGPISEVITRRILRKGESLYEEPLHLLREEQTIRTPGTYFKLCAAIANGATQYNEISTKAKIDNANLAKMLPRLDELGYVERRAPLERRGFVERRSSYRLRDPFFRFWFRYVWPNRSRLERGRVREVAAKIEADFDTFMGAAFEDVCRTWLGTYATGPEAQDLTEIGAWWHRSGNPEIDIVTLRGRRLGPLGSCKWDRNAPPQALGELLRDREMLAGPDTEGELLVFARGFSNDLIQRAEREGARLVGIDELYG
jgi:AAA+ ATPase superfamily predicted ATPase